MAPKNFSTGNEYQGKNSYILALTGRKNPEWGTYLQWKAAGYQVQKGEKGTPIQAVCTKKTEDGEESKGVRYYRVFNREQVKAAG